MKNKVIVAACFLTLFTSCEQKLNTYDWYDMVYFDVQKNRQVQDTTKVTFAYQESSVTEMLVPIRVKLIGNLKDYDRKIDIEIVDIEPAGSVVKAFDPDTCFIRKNTNYLDVNVLLKRSPELQTRQSKFVMRLKDNSEFKLTTKREVVDVANNKSVDLINHVIVFSDIIERPLVWGVDDPYFGTFSSKKLLLICEVTGYERKIFTDYNLMGSGRANYIKNTMEAYFAKYKLDHSGDAAALEKIKEIDGSYMTMGK